MQVQYGTVERAVSRMRAGDFLFVLDLMDCFYIWRVLPSDTFMLGFYSESRKQYGKYDYLANGLKPAPGINDDNVEEILRLVQLDTGIILTDFVDDFVGSASTEHFVWEKLEDAVSFFFSSMWCAHQSEEWWCQSSFTASSVDWLGIRHS